jgi:hypothetical protein
MDKKKTGILALVLAVVAGWAFGFFDATDPEVAELQQLRDEALNLGDEERRTQFQDLRQRVEGLSEDQRQAFRESSRGGFREAMTQRMNEFFEMPPQVQTERLDEMIDNMQQRPPNQNQGGLGRGGDMTADQRDQRGKQRLDRSTPEMRAKMDRFRDMLNDRRQQRGLDPVEGGRGFPGGRGGRDRLARS